MMQKLKALTDEIEKFNSDLNQLTVAAEAFQFRKDAIEAQAEEIGLGLLKTRSMLAKFRVRVYQPGDMRAEPEVSPAF